MKKFLINKICLLLFTCLFSIILISCQKNEDTKVTNIVITGNSEMLVGDKQTLDVTVYPDYATNKEYTISSSNLEVATIDGLEVTALTKGTTIITAIANDGSSVQGELSIEVKEVVIDPTDITITGTKESLEIGEELQLQALIIPSNATSKNITWTTSDASIATVTAGKVVAISEGEVTITASTDNDFSDSFTFTIKKALLATENVQSLLVNAYNEYKNSLIGTAKMTIAQGEEVSTLDFIFEFKDKATVTQLCYLFEGEKKEVIYVRSDVAYMDMNDSKGKYSLVSSEHDTFTEIYNFDKFFSSGIVYFTDNNFFDNLDYDSCVSYTDKDNACYKYILDLRNYTGTSINTIGVDEVCLYVTLVNGEVASFELTSASDDVITSIKIELKGFQCVISYPEDLDSYPDM